MTTSEGILKWVADNKDWFKPTYIATKLKIDRGNFSRFMKSEIPEKYLIPIMSIIMPLGFTLDEIAAENNKPEVKAKILDERNPPLASSVRWSNPLTETKMINPDIEARIKVLEYEINHPPKTAIIGVRNWIRAREIELAKLKSNQ